MGTLRFRPDAYRVGSGITVLLLAEPGGTGFRRLGAVLCWLTRAEQGEARCLCVYAHRHGAICCDSGSARCHRINQTQPISTADHGLGINTLAVSGKVCNDKSMIKQDQGERLIPSSVRVKLTNVTTTIDRAPRRDMLMRSVPKAKRVKPAKRGGIIVGSVHVYHEL